MKASRLYIPNVAPPAALVICVAWAALAWLLPEHYTAAWMPSVLWHKIASVALVTGLSIQLFLAVSFDRTQSR